METKKQTNKNTPLGGQGASTAAQRAIIQKHCNYDQQHKEELAYHYSNRRTNSLRQLTYQEAQEIINGFKTNWAKFNKENRQHMYMLSLLRQIGWTEHSAKYGKIADLDRFSDFLKSNKSPVNKPLKIMTSEDCSKIINCLESMLGKKHSK